MKANQTTKQIPSANQTKQERHESVYFTVKLIVSLPKVLMFSVGMVQYQYLDKLNLLVWRNNNHITLFAETVLSYNLTGTYKTLSDTF